MTVRDRRAAVDAFVDPLQRAVSCVTREILIREQDVRAQPPAFRFPRQAARLRGRHRLELSVVVELVLDEEDQPSRIAGRSVGYRYELAEADGPMLLAYHWHSIGISPITWPHLHLGGSLRGIDLSKAHLPTNFVSLQDVLRFAIVDLDVEPQREDWRDVLTTELDRRP